MVRRWVGHACRLHHLRVLLLWHLPSWNCLGDRHPRGRLGSLGDSHGNGRRMSDRSHADALLHCQGHALAMLHAENQCAKEQGHREETNQRCGGIAVTARFSTLVGADGPCRAPDAAVATVRLLASPARSIGGAAVVIAASGATALASIAVGRLRAVSAWRAALLALGGLGPPNRRLAR